MDQIKGAASRLWRAFSSSRDDKKQASSGVVGREPASASRIAAMAEAHFPRGVTNIVGEYAVEKPRPRPALPPAGLRTHSWKQDMAITYIDAELSKGRHPQISVNGTDAWVEELSKHLLTVGYGRRDANLDDMQPQAVRTEGGMTKYEFPLDGYQLSGPPLLLQK